MLPPNPKQWAQEHNGLDLRAELDLDNDIALPHGRAFGLLDGVFVYALGEVPLELKHLTHLRGAGRTRWSGLALHVCDGIELVVFNDAHPETRVRATLMEEFFHLRLNHPKSELRVYSDSTATRTFRGTTEAEAYESGAAALVPYAGLKKLVDEHWQVRRIARQFEVSSDLILFRAKVTRLYKRLNLGQRWSL